MSAKIIVKQNAKILNSIGLEKLHVYPNGDTLFNAPEMPEMATGSEAIKLHRGFTLLKNDEPIYQVKNQQTSENLIAEENQNSSGEILAFVELIGPVDPDWLIGFSRCGIQP